MCSTQLEAHVPPKPFQSNTPKQQVDQPQLTSAAAGHHSEPSHITSPTNQQVEHGAGSGLHSPLMAPKYEPPFSPSATAVSHQENKHKTDNMMTKKDKMKMKYKKAKLLAAAAAASGPGTQPASSSEEERETHSNRGRGKSTGKDTDLATCSRLVVDHVIESMYSKELVNEANSKRSANISPTKTSTNPAPALASKSQNEVTNKVKIKVGEKSEAGEGGVAFDKTSLTFGQIQETLIRRAVENSYELNLTSDSGVKTESENLYETKASDSWGKLRGKPEQSGKELDKENIKRAEVKEENDPYAFTDVPTSGEIEYIPKKFRSSKLKDNKNSNGNRVEKAKADENVQNGHESLDGSIKSKKKRKVGSQSPSYTESAYMCISNDKQNNNNNNQKACWTGQLDSSNLLGSESPSQTFCDSEVHSWSGESREEDCDWPDSEDYGVRKSQRSNRGRKYQELIEQGYLQSSRDKAAVGKRPMQG